MRKMLVYVSIVGVMILSLFSLGAQDVGANSFNNGELDSAEKQKLIQQYEEFFGPIKRAATEEEIEKINETIEEKLKTNKSFTMGEVLEELGLEDVGYQEADSSDSVHNLNLGLYKYKDSYYEYGNANGDISTNAINFGSMGFRNPSHSSTKFSATLQFTNIGFSKLDSLNAMVTPYTKTSSGGWVQNGDFQYIAETQLIIGTTILGTYSVPHSNRGAKLEAVGVIVHKGEGTVLSPASAIYNAK